MNAKDGIIIGGKREKHEKKLDKQALVDCLKKHEVHIRQLEHRIAKYNDLPEDVPLYLLEELNNEQQVIQEIRDELHKIRWEHSKDKNNLTS